MMMSSRNASKMNPSTNNNTNIPNKIINDNKITIRFLGSKKNEPSVIHNKSNKQLQFKSEHDTIPMKSFNNVNTTGRFRLRPFSHIENGRTF